MDETEPITLKGDVPYSKERTGRAMLTVVRGPPLGQVFRVEQEETSIGRGNEAEITVSGEGISRLHTKLVMSSDGGGTLIDLGSTNGTYVNGVRIVAEPLRDNDRIQLGRSLALLFRYEYRRVSNDGDGDEDGDEEDDKAREHETESMDGVYETIASTLDNLARMYEGKGDLERALAICQRSLSMHQDKLGDDHPSVVAIAKRVEMLEQRLGAAD